MQAFGVCDILGKATSLLQHSSPALLLDRKVCGVLIDKDDSVSACSKKTYFTASNRARDRVMTCSMSKLQRERGRK